MDAGQPPAREEAVEAAALGRSWGSLPTQACRESAQRAPMRHTDTEHAPRTPSWPLAPSPLPSSFPVLPSWPGPGAPPGDWFDRRHRSRGPCSPQLLPLTKGLTPRRASPPL